LSERIVKLEIEIGGRARSVELAHVGERLRWTIEGRALEADAVEVAPGVYSILIGGQSLEARAESTGSGLRVFVAGQEYSVRVSDPRQWQRRRSRAVEAEGRQQVLAPMPGKIIRVLVKVDDEVEAGQGLLIVEAMKMQNEIRSPKSGKVERLLVVEGQTVNAGEVLAIVT
jgi:biotin carboxyl carrier protein